MDALWRGKAAVASGVHQSGPFAGGTLEARYANYFEIGHTDVEFLMQFGQSYQTEIPPVIHTLVVTDPSYVRTFIQLLQESLADFEAMHGPIRPASGGDRVDG